MKRFVLYRRVSTEDQGRSGLGLDAQQVDLDRYLERFAEVPHEVIGSFVDVQSGRDNERPELDKALALVKGADNCELLISKLDRLSRRVSFVARLMEEQKVDLRIADMPDAGAFQMHIFAALAEQERALISQRTKAGLAAAKARGVTLGGNRHNIDQINAARTRNADEFAERVAGIVLPLLERGESFAAAARALNDAGVRARRGGKWQAVQVQRIHQRLKAI